MQKSTSCPLASVARLIDASAREDFASTDEQMQYCAGVVRGLMDEIRVHADALEAEVADE
jgi:glutamine synthetase